MKELNFEQMENLNGGESYYSCNLGMAAVGIFWSAMAGVATGGIGAAVVGFAWSGLTAYVCKDA
ncbi:hypothetical protein [Carboxylicivirga caseinilyticus]|uniref:hypothetical protein n=1 Tax=Carboxylicivirga caseinilyticus TaxID=3417572 RepID=UPI003D357991|nr:hypothetical protein [Marinilabiliaceae bacterium A049]